MTAQVTKSSQVQQSLNERGGGNSTTTKRHESSPQSDVQSCFENNNEQRFACKSSTANRTGGNHTKIKRETCSAANGTASAASIFDPTAGLTSLDKEMIYSHPLFPLLNNAFDKCTTATCTPRNGSTTAEMCSAGSFNDDIKQFVASITNSSSSSAIKYPAQQDHQLSDIDSLLVQSIRVFRFHLLEIDKVFELCDNFCHRYISCLKGKLPTELICDETGPPTQTTTRTTKEPITSQQKEEDFCQAITSEDFYSQRPIYIPSMNIPPISRMNAYPDNPILYREPQEPQPQDTTYIGHDSRSGQGLYMRQPPPPQQIQEDNPAPRNQVYYVPQTNRPKMDDQLLKSSDSVIVPRKRMLDERDSANDDLLQQPQSSSSSFNDDSRRRPRKRGIFPKYATNILRDWLFKNLNHPYPTEEQKKQLAEQTGLTILQVNNWFINARRRIVQPMIDQSARGTQIPSNPLMNPPGHPAPLDYGDYLAAARYIPVSDPQVPQNQSFHPVSSPATGFEVMAAAAAARAAAYQQHQPIGHPMAAAPPNYYVDDGSSFSVNHQMNNDDNYGAFRRFPHHHPHHHHQIHQHLPMQQQPQPQPPQSPTRTSAASNLNPTNPLFHPQLMMNPAVAAAAAAAVNYSNPANYGLIPPPQSGHSPQPPVP